MKTVNFLYGRTTFDLEVPDDTPVLTSNVDALKSDKDGYEIVKEAMDHPIDSPHLYELAKGKPDCTIIISDHTRPVPSQDILPHMIRELRCGNPDIKITLLVATGFHRPTTVEELRGKLGDALYEEFKDNIIVHDAHDPSKNIKIGNLPSGPDCIIDKVAYNASLLVAEGFIEAHFFAGFSGGRKSVLPGICDAVTVMGNHCGEFIASPYARTGILDKNPIHEDMVAAAEMAKLAFICNVVIDEDKKTVAAFAGNFKTAHRKGVDFLSGYCAVKPAPADIVITTNGGYPLDQNLYQSPKAVATAEACCKDGGVIIMCASCIDGMGGTHFEKLIVNGSVEEIDEYLSKIPPKETIPEQWCAQIYSRILKKHTVILVTTYLDHDLVRKANMIPASSPDEALQKAYDLVGKDASVVVIPDGVAVLAVKEGQA